MATGSGEIFGSAPPETPLTAASWARSGSREQRDLLRDGDPVHPGADRTQTDRADEIDYARARNAAKRDHTFDLQRVDLRENQSLLLFAGCLMLFHFSNASLLPLVSQNLGQSKAAWGPLFMAGLVIVPQVVVALLAPWIGYCPNYGGASRCC